MNIKTKYKPHSLVWMMWENKAIEVEVYDLEVRIYQVSTGPVLYSVFMRVMRTGNLLAGLHNEDLFCTDKQALLDSL